MAPIALIILGILLWLYVTPALGIVLFVAGLIWLILIGSSWRGPGPRRYFY